MAKSNSGDPIRRGIYPNELIIHEGNYGEFCTDSYEVNGQKVKRGLIPRDYKTHPQGFYKAAPAWSVDMRVIPQGEWSERCADKIKQGSRLSDIRNRGNNGKVMKSTDQNGRGYCWAHSGTSALLLQRANMNEPYVALSAYGVACIIKDYRDEGGWGAQGVDFLMERGCPSEEFWPQQATSSKYDKPATWENAAKHKVTAGFIDLQAAQYDRNLTFAQYATCWLLNMPTIDDHNWWGHSICGMDLVDGSKERKHTRVMSGKLATLKEFHKIWAMDDEVTAGFGGRIWNSWGDSWSENGTGVLTGSKAVPDGGVAIRAATPSEN